MYEAFAPGNSEAWAESSWTPFQCWTLPHVIRDVNKAEFCRHFRTANLNDDAILDDSQWQVLNYLTILTILFTFCCYDFFGYWDKNNLRNLSAMICRKITQPFLWNWAEFWVCNQCDQMGLFLAHVAIFDPSVARKFERAEFSPITKLWLFLTLFIFLEQNSKY